MKIATWNVNGIRARHEQVEQFLATESPQVLCLQEIKATPEQVPTRLREREDYCSFWHGGGKGYSGVALLVQKSFAPGGVEFFHPPFDFENRIVVARLGSLQVASIYVPNGGRGLEQKMTFLSELEGFAAGARAAGETLLLAGDLNVAHREIDVHPRERREVIGQSTLERTQLDRLLGEGLVDLGRALHPEEEGLFTWWAPWRQMRAKNIGWRLDYLLASAALAATAQACEVRREFGTSDHAPVLATFSP